MDARRFRDPHATSRSALRLGALFSFLAFASGVATAAALAEPSLAPGQDIRQETGEITVNATATTVVRYTWRDSAGDPRSVSLLPASGATSGYAVQMTYQVTDGAKRTVYVNADPAGDGGFGYFVSHELFRPFAEGGEGTIAGLHGNPPEDDSPLGRYFPSTGSAQSVAATQATQEFRHDYPRWGTIAAVPDPTVAISTNPNTHQKFQLPVVIRWHFVAGQDYPVWVVQYDLTAAGDRISNDVRGPYGTMHFNEGNAPDITALRWGDKYRFAADAGAADFGATAQPAATLAWTWSALNTGRRYNVLGSNAYEFGLVETIPYAASRLGAGYANFRGMTSASGGCAYGMLSIPCDWEWPYQSFQYDYGPPSRPKLAWGSSFYLGSSLTESYLTNTEFDTISPKGRISYGIHIVLGRAGAGTPLTLAKANAAVEPDRALTVASAPANGGTVTYSVLGDAGGPYADAGRTLGPWKSVALTATPAGNFGFTGWSGACAGVSGNTCLVTMSAALSVTANFASAGPSGDSDNDGVPDAVEPGEGLNPLVKDNDIFANARLFAMQQYRDFLGREGDAGGIGYYVNLLNTGAASRAGVTASFFNSPEFQNTGAAIVRLYAAFFNRIPDHGGFEFQANALRTGTSLGAIANNFALAPEFQATYGALTNAQYVQLLYQNVLGRTPVQAEIDFHVNRLNTGVTRGEVMIGFSESPEYVALKANGVLVVMLYEGLLRRAADAGGFAYWVNLLNAGTPGVSLIAGFQNSPEYYQRFLP